MTQPEFYVQPMTGATGKPYYRILRRGNREILHTSEAYYSRSNRNRAVRRLVKLGGGLFMAVAESSRTLPD